MINKETIDKLLSCVECPFGACEQCEFTQNDKKAIKEYIEHKEKMIKLMAQELTIYCSENTNQIKDFFEKVANNEPR